MSLNVERIPFLKREGREYKRAKRTLEEVFVQTCSAKHQLTADEDGNEIHHSGYIAGLKIAERMTNEQAERLEELMERSLSEELGTYELPTSGGSLFGPSVGCCEGHFFMPILRTPETVWDKTKVTPDESQRLDDLALRVKDVSSVRLYYLLVSARLGGGYCYQEPPEGLLMEDGADYVLQLHFQPDFRGKDEAADKVLKILLANRAIVTTSQELPNIPLDTETLLLA